MKHDSIAGTTKGETQKVKEKKKKDIEKDKYRDIEDSDYTVQEDILYFIYKLHTLFLLKCKPFNEKRELLLEPFQFCNSEFQRT